MRVKVLEACSPYYNYGLVDLAEGQEVSGGLALFLLETRSNVEPADEAAEQWLAAADSHEPAGESEQSDPPAGMDIDATAADVLAWVGDDLQRATEALDAEQAKDKPRSTLVKQLEKLATSE